MNNYINGEIIITDSFGDVEIGYNIIGSSSSIIAKIIDIKGTTLYIMKLPFILERQFNNVLFKMFER